MPKQQQACVLVLGLGEVERAGGDEIEVGADGAVWKMGAMFEDLSRGESHTRS